MISRIRRAIKTSRLWRAIELTARRYKSENAIVAAFMALYTGVIAALAAAVSVTNAINHKPLIDGAWGNILVGALFLLPAFNLVRLATLGYSSFRKTEPLTIAFIGTPYETTRVFYDNNRATSDGLAQYPVGGIIPLIPHPNIDYTVEDNGWAPEEVIINCEGEFPIGELPADVIDNFWKDTNSKPKYSLKELPPPFKDSTDTLNLRVDATEYNATAGTSSYLKMNQKRRHELLACNPKNRRVPHSLCLHCVVEFSEGSFLGLQRNKLSAYYGGAFSFSFEEQLDKLDFRTTPYEVMQHWIHRSICEEIFPMQRRYEKNPEISWSRIQQYVKFSRVLSLFMEEEIGGYALVCHIVLNLTPLAYVECYRVMKGENDKRDSEGRLFMITHQAVISALKGNDKGSIATELLLDYPEDTKPFGDDEIITSLHPSSTYRALLVLTAQKKI